MADSNLYDEKLVEGTQRLFCCCSIRAKAIIDQATEFNYLDILEGQVKNHERISADSQRAWEDQSGTDSSEPSKPSETRA